MGLLGFSPGTATEQKSLKHPVFILEVMGHVFTQPAFIERLLDAELSVFVLILDCSS